MTFSKIKETKFYEFSKYFTVAVTSVESAIYVLSGDRTRRGGRTDKCMGGRGRLRELICDSVMRGKPTQVFCLAVFLCIFLYFPAM